MSKKILSKKFKLLKISCLVLLGVSFLSATAFGIYSSFYSDKIFPNTTVGEIPFGGKTKAQSREIIEQGVRAFQSEDFLLGLAGTDQKFTIDPMEIGLEFNVDESLNDLWSRGHEQGARKAFLSQLQSLYIKREVVLSYKINEEGLRSKVNEIAAAVDQPEKDLTIVYKDNNFVLLDERQAGQRIDQSEMYNLVTRKIARLEKVKIDFSAQKFEPQVIEINANQALLKANQILGKGELVLTDGSTDFTIDRDTLGGMVVSQSQGRDLVLVFNNDRAKKYVDSLAKNINLEPVSAKLSMADGKVTVFQPSKDGKVLDKDTTLKQIEEAIFQRVLNEAAPVQKLTLKIDYKKPEISDTDIGNLGITEMIATATTNFKGSPANRVHNITVGAAALNGVMLKAGEEFSTLAHLGVIDASGGYLEELVIKENRTVPEFGGGLCQVSSTLFRAALNAGLKIVERQNHKYRVSYYEPPVGMDATIYDPAPDFKFVNNYQGHILIQSKITGTKITFELYGTKDGRKIEIGTPSVYDYVNPSEPIIVETDTLAPGERKQIEKAHQGATASFNYKVVSIDNNLLQEKTFKSKYVAWPEKWLVGKQLAVETPPPAVETPPPAL